MSDNQDASTQAGDKRQSALHLGARKKPYAWFTYRSVRAHDFHLAAPYQTL